MLKKETEELCGGCKGRLEPTPPMLVNELSRLFHGRMRAYETSGVMTQESSRQIMRVLAHEDGCSQLDLVHRTHLKPPTVSICLKRLEAEGLVCRRNDEMDLRVCRVYLTERGAEHNALIRERLRVVDAELMRGFDEREKAELLQYLERMRDNILPERGKNNSCLPSMENITDLSIKNETENDQ